MHTNDTMLVFMQAVYRIIPIIEGKLRSKI